MFHSNSPKTNGGQDLAEPCPRWVFHTSSSVCYLWSPPHLTSLPAAGLVSSSLDCTPAHHLPAKVPLACLEASLSDPMPPPLRVASPQASSFGGLSLPPTSLERSPHGSWSPSLRSAGPVSPPLPDTSRAQSWGLCSAGLSGCVSHSGGSLTSHRRRVSWRLAPV